MEVTFGFVEAAAADVVDSHRREEGALRGGISEAGRRRRLGRGEEARSDRAQQRAVEVQDRDMVEGKGSRC